MFGVRGTTGVPQGKFLLIFGTAIRQWVNRSGESYIKSERVQDSKRLGE